MKEIKVQAGSELYDTVNTLIEARNNGEEVFATFNGVTLYSSNVTMDSAYREVTGMSKSEFDSYKAKTIEEIEKYNEEEKERALKELPEQIERGNNVILPFRREDWAKLVEADANGMYYGLISSDALEIMEAIEEEKSEEELLKMFDEQGHSGWSASLTRNVVMTFSKNGYPFYKATHFGEWTENEVEYVKSIVDENNEHLFEDLMPKRKDNNKARALVNNPKQ